MDPQQNNPQQNNPQQPYGYPPQPPYQPSQETQPLPQQPYGYPPQLPNQGQQPYQPDTPQQPYTPNPPQQPPKKGKGGIIAAAIIGFLLVAGGVGAALYFLNKDKEPAKTGLSDTLKQKKASESVGEGDLVIDEGTTASGGAEASGEQPTAGETIAANGDDLEALERRLSQFEYTSYENDRFGYRVNIPNFMAPGPEPQNGDGRAYYYRDITLSTYASNNALDNSIAEEIKLRDPNAHKEKVGANFFIITGSAAEGKVYNEKTVLRNGVFYTVRLEYPEKYTSVMMPLRQIVDNFEP